MSLTQRSRRVSMTQLHHLWEFLNSHREIAVGFNNKSTQAREHSRQMWKRAAEILNSTGEGAIKSGSEWSKYWIDLKAKLKRKNRLITDSRRRTGGGPATNLELSDIDRKFLSILGHDYGSGLPGVRVEPQGALALPEHEENIADPSNLHISQSTASEEPIYLVVPSSEEYQQSELHEVSVTSQHSYQLPILPDPANTSSHQSPVIVPVSIVTSQHSSRSPVNVVPATPQPSPSRRGTTGQGARRRLVLPVEEPSSSSRRGTSEQGQTRRRRRLGQQMSAADARERLVISSERRSQAELANSRSIERVVDYLGEIVSILRNIQAGLPDAAARGAQQDPAL